MEKGDIVHIEYELWIKNPKTELFESNIEKVAKDNNKWNENEKYTPMPVIVGYSRQMKILEDSIMKAEIGKEYNVEITPIEGFGERDPNKVKLYLMREILKLPQFQRKDAKYPEIGMEVIIDDKVGTISGIYAGRARIDFNHRLAGRTLDYKYKVIGKDSKPEEKVKSIIEMAYGSSKDFSIEHCKDGSFTVTLPDVCKYDNKWFMAKYKIVADLRDIVGLKLVRFVEEYRKKEEKVEDEKNEDKKEGEDKKHHTKKTEEKKEHDDKEK